MRTTLGAMRHKFDDDALTAFGTAMVLRGMAERQNREPADYAERNGASDRVVGYLKADALAATAASSLGASFIDYLRNSSALDAMSRWTIPAQPHQVIAIRSTSWTANDVGECVAKPVQAFAFSETSISPQKSAAVTAVTTEFLQQPINNVQAYITRAQRDAVASQMNTSFFSAVSQLQYGEANVGNDDMAHIATDLRELFKMLAYGTGSKIFVFVSVDQAIHLASLAISVGSNEMTILGGRFMGADFIVSENLPTGVIFAIDATGLAWWDGGVDQAVSDQAAIQLLTNPTNAPGPVSVTATALTSAFQAGLTLFKCERSYGFKVVRPNAVASLHGVTWGAADSPAGA